MRKSKKNETKSGAKNEFTLYNRIVNRDLRPNIDSFNNQEGLQALQDEFYSIKVKIDEGMFNPLDIDSDFHGFKPGDKFEMKISEDSGSPKITITSIENSDEDQLINLDIPPPPNKKAEIFLNIIEDEYNRIKSSLTKNLEVSKNANELKIYAIKNIQIAKKIARESHTFEKKLKKKGIEDWDNPNTYIIYVLKKYLIYSLIEIQELFNPFTKERIQSEFELVDELYDLSYSKMMDRVKIINEDLSKLHIEKLYEQLGKNPNAEEKITFFKTKFLEQIKLVAEKSEYKYRIPKYLYDNMALYRKELGKILSDYYYRKLITESNKIGIVEKYEEIMKTITALKVNYDSIESQALKTSDFFVKIELEKDLLKELMNLSFSYPIEANILSDLISFLIVLQTRKHLNLSEDQMNDYLSDLLRAKQYYVADQSRSGRSGSQETSGYKSGELDISIRDIKNNGIIKTIIETFEITSCGNKTKKIKEHINKLMNRYDTAGNVENYVIIFSKASKFKNIWFKYKNHVESIVFNNEVKITDIENEKISKSDIKVGINSIVREGKKLKLYHLFINMRK